MSTSPLRPSHNASFERSNEAVVTGEINEKGPQPVESLALPSSSYPGVAHQSRPTRAVAVATLTTRSAPFDIAAPPAPAPAESNNLLLHKTKSAPSAITTIAPPATTTASHNKKPFPKALGRPPRFRRRSNKTKKNKMSNSMMVNGGPPENALQWLEACCPNEVVSKVLAFCGPHMVATLMATNRYWFYVIAHNDATWRTLCEGMYKWREEEDDLPTTSWKEYYRLHPCVPVDYPTIPRALAVATAKKSNSMTGSSPYSQYIRSNSNSNTSKKEQIRSVEILLRPGKHFVKESLLVTAAPNVTVTMKTMELPKDRFYSPRLAYAEQEHAQSFPESSKSKSRKESIRQWMSCKSVESTAVEGGAGAGGVGGGSIDADVNFYDSDSSENSVLYNRSRSLSATDAARIHLLSSSLMPPPKYPERATLVLRTRRQNEPVIRIRQGNFYLKRVDLEHASQGVDIWNGNAAIQVQPPLGPDNEPVAVVPKPSATLENVAISSKSGRGVVCLDGGQVQLRDCMIFDCAATGLYIGGPGSEANISSTDVIRNGIGSRLPPSRAPRVTSGHSGVYLEQGVARINECNISSNYLTGISAVSFERAFLVLSKSDLVANGQGNLEMPPPGTTSHDKSEIANDNNLASVGRPCLRSGLELPPRMHARASF